MNIVTFTELRRNLRKIMDEASDQHEPVFINRTDHEHMVLLSLTDYESLKETAYLLGTEANAQHLRDSLENMKKGNIQPKDLFQP
ncbi:MAG: type II toxin-antitoxin system Phd/YefM family antitoxin [Gammaproteobacteria bacterium]